MNKHALVIIVSLCLPIQEGLSQTPTFQTSLDQLLRAVREEKAVDSLIQNVFSLTATQEDSISVFMGLGIGYYRQRDYPAAIQYLAQILEIENASLDKVAQASRFIGLSYGKEGNYLEAKLYYSNALDIFNILNLHRGAGSCGKALANIYSRWGDFDKAIFLLKEAHHHYQQPPANQDQIAYTLLELSNAYGFKKNSNQGELYLQQALEVSHLSEKAKGIMEFNYGGILAEQGKTKLAIKEYEKARTKLLEAGYYTQLLGCIQNLGNLYAQDSTAQSQQKAMAYYLEALALVPELLGNPNRREVSDLYLNIGELMVDQGNYQKGVQAYQQALYRVLPETVDTLDFLQYPSDSSYYCENKILLALRGKAACLEAMGKREIAIAHYMAMIQAQEQLSSCNTYESSKQILVEDQRNSLGKALGLLVEDNSMQEEAFFFFEKSKAQILNETSRVLLAQEAFLPDRMRMEGKKLATQIADAQRLLQQGKDQGSRQRNRLDSLFYLRSNYDEKVDAFFEQQLESFQTLSYYSLTEVQEHLSEDQLMIQYVVEPIPYALAISSQESRMYLLDSLEQHVERFRDLLAHPSSLSGEQAVKQYVDHGYLLFQILLAPILQDFPDYKQLILVPDGPLQRLPFEAFLTEQPDLEDFDETEAYDNFWKGKRRVPNVGASYLLFDYDIHYAFSAGLWIDAAQDDRSSTDELQSYSARYTEKDSFAEQLILPIPSASLHAEKISAMFGKKGPPKTSRKQFLESAHRTQYLHLAMHGFADSDEPMRSALAFSKGESSEHPHLLVADLYAMPRLTANLVSLLACKSGDGKEIRGEGIMSLGRAFRLSGAQSVVMSLWDADARIGGEILEKMYQEIQAGNSFSASLQQAKVQHLQQAKASEAYPVYWANYVLMGNGAKQDTRNFPLWWVLGALLLGVGILFLKKRQKI